MLWFGFIGSTKGHPISATYGEIAKGTRTSTRTVGKNISCLESLGLIQVQRPPGKPLAVTVPSLRGRHIG